MSPETASGSPVRVAWLSGISAVPIGRPGSAQARSISAGPVDQPTSSSTPGRSRTSSQYRCASSSGSTRGGSPTSALVERAQRAGVPRPDVDLTDIGLLVWASVRATEGVRTVTPDAWRRHLALVLDGLRTDAAHPLPGRPLDPETVRRAMAFDGIPLVTALTGDPPL